MDTHSGKNPYPSLALMILLSFVAMYGLMYAMVDVSHNVFHNLNQFYMAGLMTSAMLIIELAVMRSMYNHAVINALILVGGIVVLVGCWMAIRQQTAISDEQFVKSMIPHHASALLMCEKASLRDVELQELCRKIIAGQQSEIDFMKTKLKVLENN